MTVLAAAAEGREAGPIGLVVILCLVVALIFLIRSMNKHLRKVSAGSFARAGTPADPAPADAPAAADPAPADPGTDRTT